VTVFRNGGESREAKCLQGTPKTAAKVPLNPNRGAPGQSLLYMRLQVQSGGIRGIVELEVLRAVEQALGGKIPIQAFFDLMVGTR
jgi:hypothetical protein